MTTSVLLSDNGVSSGSAGIKTQGGNDGTLQLQTTTSGGTATTAVTIDTSQNTTLAGTLTTSAKGIAKASLPAGSVLQVINASYSTQVSSTSSSPTNTGLSATITPTSATSKILVIVDHTGLAVSTNATAINLTLLRSGSSIGNIGNVLGYPPSGGVSFSSSAAVLDSPATTSATTYTTQFVNWQATGTVYAQWQASTSHMILMEIAA